MNSTPESPPLWPRVLAPLVAALVFVGALVISFPPYTQAWGVFVFLIPFVLWAFSAPPRWAYWLTAFFASWAGWFILLIWLQYIYPPWGWVGLAILSATLGLFSFVWLCALRRIAPRIKNASPIVRVVALLGLAGLWVVLEWTRAWLFSGFPWLPLATAFWRLPALLQLAAWTGQWGISFMVVAFNLGVAFYGQRHFARRASAVVWPRAVFSLELYLPLILLFGAVFLYFGRVLDSSSGSPAPLLRAGIVQPWTPALLKWSDESLEENLNTLQELTLGFKGSDVDVIVWPEAAPPFPVAGPGTARPRAWVQQLVDETAKPLLLGAIATAEPVPGGPENAGYYNAFFVMQPGHGLEPTFYAKRHLVPFGEYVPLRRWLPFLGKVVPLEGDTLPGVWEQPLPLRLASGKTLSAGPLICYEDVFPALARAQARAGADFLVVVTNDAWYGTGGGALQHAAHSVLRAVETRRPVLRCGNDGWSGWIDEEGYAFALVKNGGSITPSRLLFQSGTTYFKGKGTLDVLRDPAFNGYESFYVRYGDWFVALSGLFALLAAWCLRHPPLQFEPTKRWGG